MSMPDLAQQPVNVDEFREMTNGALMLAAESLGSYAALQLRNEFKALACAHSGRLLVIGERGQRADELVCGLLDVPTLAQTLHQLPRVHTTFRFSTSATMVLTTRHGETTVDLPAGSFSADDSGAGHAMLSGPLLQVDISMQSPFLSWFGVVHLPALHDPERQVSPFASFAPESLLVYVKSASAPLSGAELAFLREARVRVRRLVLVVTNVSQNPAWRDVVRVNRELLSACAAEPEEAPSIVVLREGEADIGLAELREWLEEARNDVVTPLAEAVGMVRTVAELALAGESGRASPHAAANAAAALRDAERRLSEAARGSQTWLPRMSFMFAQLRSELGERLSQSLVHTEQRNEQWIQDDVTTATEDLPRVLLAELQALERGMDDALSSSLEALTTHLLGGRSHEFSPGGVREIGAVRDVQVALVTVSRLNVDKRTEMFASLGNFGSGRQSLSLLSSTASFLTGPVALLGAAVGLGFWRIGRRSRQDAHARIQASRWLKSQIGEAGRIIRYRIDQGLNEAQMTLNLAVRDYYDRLQAEGRQSVEAAKASLVEAEGVDLRERERRASIIDRATALLEKCDALLPSSVTSPDLKLDGQ
jgi:hypothetical protein